MLMNQQQQPQQPQQPQPPPPPPPPAKRLRKPDIIEGATWRIILDNPPGSPNRPVRRGRSSSPRAFAASGELDLNVKDRESSDGKTVFSSYMHISYSIQT